ncbi:MAG: hypothetical protein EB075_12105, partial [Bacteroidetes bacterium]|nr:hypothetical protein [Bacteroidota bacterium]
MGITGLSKVIKQRATNAVQTVRVEDLPRGVYGVDVSIYLHPAKYNAAAKGKGSHVRAFFDMICMWRAAGHQLVMVFDGEAGDAKQGTLDKRLQERDRKETEIYRLCTAINGQLPESHRSTTAIDTMTPEDVKAFARTILGTCFGGDQERMELEQHVRNTIDVCPEDYDDLRELFDVCGVPYATAVGEADHLLALLAKQRVIHGVVSEDSDMLTHGTPMLIRGLIQPGFRRSHEAQVINQPQVLQAFDLTYPQFVDVCILSGCDYCEKLGGVACRTAIRLVREHRDVDGILHAVNGGTLSGVTVPDGFFMAYQRAYHLFTDHSAESTVVEKVLSELEKTPY